jgi:ACS family tartrate transporter-like MFS transporter
VLAYFFSYLDRVNLGFAALTMNAELKFTPLIFAWGAGIFFIGYFIFEVPSNLALEKFGASRWIARIMVTWGIISALMALSGELSFYVLRFLLGVAEAGFFPGIILYLTYWYPAEYRARFLAAFAIAVPVSTVIGAPISGLLLGLDGVMGLKGWQWLFIIEGIPSVLLGIVTWFYLTDRPEKADWLTAEQKAWLKAKLQAEIATKQAVKHLTLGEALSSPKVITLSLVYFGFVGALYGMQFWLPQIVKAFGLTNAQTGFVTAIPYLFGTIAMILWARHSDATRERVAHVGGPLLLTAVALGVSSYITDPTMTMVVLTVAAIGVFCTFGCSGRCRPPGCPARRRPAHRADQFDRQPRRLRRAVSDRLGQGSHRQTPRPACWCCRCCRLRPGCWSSSAATRRRRNSRTRSSLVGWVERSETHQFVPAARGWVSPSLSSGRPKAGPVGSTHPATTAFTARSDNATSMHGER